MSSEENIFFESIYKNTNQKILSYIIARCGNIADVSDLFQDTYLEFAMMIRKRGISYFQEPEAFVMQLAKSRIHKFYRFKKKNKTISISDFTQEDVAEEFFEEQFIEEDYVKKETLEKAKNIIESLDITTQKILYLHFFADQTIKEISLLLEIKESTIKSRMYRALRFVKEEMEDD